MGGNKTELEMQEETEKIMREKIMELPAEERIRVVALYKLYL
jgi:hypothetical protein